MIDLQTRIDRGNLRPRPSKLRPCLVYFEQDTKRLVPFTSTSITSYGTEEMTTTVAMIARIAPKPGQAHGLRAVPTGIVASKQAASPIVCTSTAMRETA